MLGETILIYNVYQSEHTASQYQKPSEGEGDGSKRWAVQGLEIDAVTDAYRGSTS